MWTKEHRRRQAAFERRRYPSDLTDAEWDRIKPLLPKPARWGRKPKVDLREILNAIRYLARAGCSWRMLPIHFGPWQTVYWWFRRSLLSGFGVVRSSRVAGQRRPGARARAGIT